jgi:hypothetical protein
VDRIKVKTFRSDKESYLYGKALERKTPPVAAATGGASSVRRLRLLFELEQVSNQTLTLMAKQKSSGTRKRKKHHPSLLQQVVPHLLENSVYSLSLSKCRIKHSHSWRNRNRQAQEKEKNTTHRCCNKWCLIS